MKTTFNESKLKTEEKEKVNKSIDHDTIQVPLQKVETMFSRISDYLGIGGSTPKHQPNKDIDN